MVSNLWIAAIITWVSLAALSNVLLDKLEQTHPLAYWTLNAGRWGAGLAGGAYAFGADFHYIPFDQGSFFVVLLGSTAVSMASWLLIEQFILRRLVRLCTVLEVAQLTQDTSVHINGPHSGPQND